MGTRSLINPGTNVKYEAKQMLKVGAVDVHLELNNLITAWIKDKSPEDVGVALAEFFEDFREEEEEDTGSSQIKGQTTDLSEMLVDAVSAAGGCPDSSSNCFVDSVGGQSRDVVLLTLLLTCLPVKWTMPSSTC